MAGPGGFALTVTITDPATLAALAAAEAGVELRGPDGRPLGRFAPSAAVEFPEFDRTVDELDRVVHNPATVWESGDAVEARLRALRDRA